MIDSRWLTGPELYALDTAPASGSAYETWIEGPRWAGLKQFIEKAVITFKVEREYVREDKTLLRSTVYFRVSGSVERVLAFKAAVLSSLAEQGCEIE